MTILRKTANISLITLSFIIFLIISIFFLCSCENKEELSNDVIRYQDITKTITNGQIDSVYTAFGFILFEINDAQEGENLVVIKSPYFVPGSVGTGSVQCIADDNFLHIVRILDRDFVISEDKNWSSISNELSLNSFAGNGQKIIGLRFYCPSNGPGNSLFFGWIKVELSENMNELKIFDFVSNQTSGNSIKAGQIE